MNATLELRYALDTFYLLISGALVMWMAAGFAMLEAGLVRAKNTTEILTKNVALYAIACIVYMLLGYNLMYPQAAMNNYLPDFSLLLSSDHETSAILNKNESNWYQSNYFSLRADFFFQVVFVATAMSIVSGAIAERMKLWSFLLFSIFMTGLIYPVQGYWKWGGGFLDQMGFLDYAGAGIVHLCGASAALAGVILLGPRKGRYGSNGEIFAVPGANLPLATLGTFILWFGWLGFNGGSQLVVSNIEAANSVASVFVNTNTAAAGGAISALIVAQLIFGKADLTMALNGAIAGLVAITAEPLTPSPELALLIGSIGGVLVVLSIIGFDKLRIDDPVGAISAHGVAGIWGLMAVCFSNTQAILSAQLLGILVIFCWSFIVSLAFWFLIKKMFGIRMSAEDEYNGADISECGIEAYPEFTNSH